MNASTPTQQVADLLRRSKRIVVLTGAGINKESAATSFRDPDDGTWSKYDPQQLATPLAFIENPKLVWDWYEHRRDLIRQTKPNSAHIALAKFEKWAVEKSGASYTLITQNVDGFHELAGSHNPIHLHGKLLENRCFYNCQGEPTIIDISTLDWDKRSGPPRCPHCGRLVRPNVVWFGEQLPANDFKIARDMSINCDLMIVAGTSGAVEPAATLIRAVRQARAKVIEINPNYSLLTTLADIKLIGKVSEVIREMLDMLENE